MRRDVVEEKIRGAGADRGRRWVLTIHVALLASISLVLLGSLQATLFYLHFAPRVEAANASYANLVEEQAGQSLYKQIRTGLQELKTPLVSDVRAAWNRFVSAFEVAPLAAIDLLQQDLDQLAEDMQGHDELLPQLKRNLGRLRAMHADPYRNLLSELADPPTLLRPVASVLAEKSGYRRAVTLNRALHQARVGETGTARVLLGGIYPSDDERELLGTVNFMLGRLQFDMLRARRDSEFLYQARHYLTRSLQADPDSRLSRKFMDYLLALAPQPSVLEVGAGVPRDATEGEGGAAPTWRRKF